MTSTLLSASSSWPRHWISLFSIFFCAVLKDFLLDISCACSGLGADVRVGGALCGWCPNPRKEWLRGTDFDTVWLLPTIGPDLKLLKLRIRPGGQSDASLRIIASSSSHRFS